MSNQNNDNLCFSEPLDTVIIFILQTRTEVYKGKKACHKAGKEKIQHLSPILTLGPELLTALLCLIIFFIIQML